MKKLLGILVLILLFSSNAFAVTIIKEWYRCVLYSDDGFITAVRRWDGPWKNFTNCNASKMYLSGPYGKRFCGCERRDP